MLTMASAACYRVQNLIVFLIKSGRGTGPVKPDNRFLKKDLVSIPAREGTRGRDECKVA